ncbi:uncharacterized protein LOC107458421 isoform X3 [Arachis duranensis]|uniref:Uncharacterized protein LOC107458421 isoform X3 n=1 Tax=Arachis duranensis TaxID=130453 RepID=A0A9C6TC69_ARADU|nr:uncharacterized protein LOC107458421 isoform X3 [Arachis duranensis]
MEPLGNTETEDGTAAPVNKTARRVSFADNEITSIHLFPSDDAEQTPPLDDHNNVVSSPFLRPIASPLSPLRTATASTDDDAAEAFHGPVLASFIEPGRLSGPDPGFSDDVTMDSTAFSMHYRSLARSDSDDLRTPSQNWIPAVTSTTEGSFMTLSDARNEICDGDSASGARDSNDMTVVEDKEYPFRYDYDRMSPSLGAISAEGSKDASSFLEISNRSPYGSSTEKDFVYSKGDDDNSAGIGIGADASIRTADSLINDKSPAKGVIDATNRIREVSTPSMNSLKERLRELRLCHGNMQELSHEGNLDGDDFSAQISAQKKRKVFEMLRGRKIMDESGRIDASPQLHNGLKSDQQLVLQQTGVMRSEKGKLDNQTRKTWADIVKNFSCATNLLLSPSTDKLNLRMISMLEDTLVQLQKVNICDAFCSEIHCQKTADQLKVVGHKRFVGARSLLFNIAYGKAKLQLMHIKRERLLKKLQLSSGLQEFQMMKLSGTPGLSKHDAINQGSDSHFHSILLNSGGKFQVSSLTTMRKEIEILDWKAKSLKEYFCTYCKMESHQSFADTIRSVHLYLKRRISCKCIFQNLQLWNIDGFELVEGSYRVFLNYYDYVIQRFTVSDCPSTSIIVSSKLNDMKIVKTFPDMDALFAFMLVLNPHTTKSYAHTKDLVQETQVTSSLLSNLLDVVEEIQLAQIETTNMVEAKFFSQSDEKLDLLLFFIDFRSGKKVKVTLDMTCLRCGVYPVSILPCRIHDAASGEQKSPSLVAEIRTAVKTVSVGYSRIMRLSRCISQVVHACTLSP